MANIKSIGGNPIVPASLDTVLADTLLTYIGMVPTPITLTDFNNAEPMGVYKIGTWTNIANRPTDNNGVLVCIGTDEYDRGHAQIYVSSSREVFYRMKWATWSAWSTVASLDTAIGYLGYINSGTLTDLNNAKPMGVYKLTDYNGVSNMPIGDVGTLLCFGTNDSDRGQAQLYITAGKGVFARVKWATWRSWRRLDNGTQEITMFVPPKLYAVVGKTYYLHHHNMTRFTSQNRGSIYGHQGTTYGVQNLGNRFKVTPNGTGSASVYMSLNNNGGIVEEKSLPITSVTDNPNVSLKAVFIGDSLTDMGFYIAQLKYLLPNLQLVGTRTKTVKDSTDTDQTVLSEGRSSWSAVDYVTLASKNDVANAFWNPSTSKFDFSYYMSNNGYSELTDVFIMLGTNDVYAHGLSSYLSAMQEIAASIATYSSSLKVHMILPPPPIDDGYAWGTRNTSNMQTWKNEMFDLWNIVVSNFGSYDIIPAGLNVDCWYDFPHTTVQVNENNPATIEVGNDNVHPSRYGFYNMADVIYAHIIGTR